MTLGPGPMRLAEIDLDALASNVAAIAANGLPVMAMVGGDALGHGLVPVARAAVAAGAEVLAVPDLDEAATLRSAGVAAPIVTWLHVSGEMTRAAALGVVPAITSLAQFDEAADAGVAEVHLVPGIGSGMSGIPAAEWDEICSRSSAGPKITGIMASVVGEGDAALRLHAAVAAAEAAGLALRRHTVDFEPGDDTAGQDILRVSATLYGLSSRPGAGVPAGLTPVMTVSGQVMNLKRVPAGVGVSYGYRYRTSKASTLAMVPLGYADGVDRAAGNRVAVQLGGRRFEIVGRVAMDAFMLDIGELPVDIGDRAVLFGDPRSGVAGAHDWAAALQTTSAEIAARIGPRVERSYR
ncbi:MAG: alanine racemase C-terminal domain-containing protein [Rhodoglobus sp.]